MTIQAGVHASRKPTYTRKKTTMMKKKSVDKTSARRLHANIKSRTTIQRNMKNMEGWFKSATPLQLVGLTMRLAIQDPIA